MAFAFVCNTLSVRPIESLWGLLLMALGLPAYLWWRRSAHSLGYAAPPTDKS
jgi:hypothetical protein